MKKILLVIGICGIIGGGTAWYLYNKPHQSMIKMKSEIQSSSIEILEAYQKDESQANDIFLGKVVTLNGEIQSIESNDPVTIVLKGTDMMSTTRCQLDHLTEHPSLSQLKPSDQITLKGICTGYLMDVIIERCIITTTPF